MQSSNRKLHKKDKKLYIFPIRILNIFRCGKIHDSILIKTFLVIFEMLLSGFRCADFLRMANGWLRNTERVIKTARETSYSWIKREAVKVEACISEWVEWCGRGKQKKCDAQNEVKCILFNILDIHNEVMQVCDSNTKSPLRIIKPNHFWFLKGNDVRLESELSKASLENVKTISWIGC